MLNVHRHSGAFVKTSMKLCNRNGCGQRSAPSAWFVVISAVKVMKANGSRKAIASAIRMLWFATAIRNCFRRTALGGRRRTNAAGAAVPTALIAAPPGAPICAS